jgi:hypothetical protein
MMKRLILILAGAAIAALSGAASAHGIALGVSIGVPAPYVYVPPVVVAPAPVYHPPGVIYAPAPAYYARPVPYYAPRVVVSRSPWAYRRNDHARRWGHDRRW